jgi:hypothetical protein
MASGFQPNPSSVDHLSGVAAAIGKLDAFYGLLASVPYAAKQLCDCAAWGPDGIWQGAYIAGTSWYGRFPNQQGPSWRSQALDGLFDAFDPQDAAENCLAPLGALAQLQNEIQAARGAVTPYQRTAVSEKLANLGQWLAKKSALYNRSFTELMTRIKDVRTFQDVMQSDNNRYQWAVDHPDSQEDVIVSQRLVYGLNNRVIEMAKSLGEPDDRIVLAWSSMQTLLSGVAQKVTNAAAADIGTALQALDIGGSLKEWPMLCEMAQRYRPGPPPPIPPTPPGFTA